MATEDRDHLDRQMRTLEHCALYRRTIELTCPQCRRVRRIDAVALWWLFERSGWDDRLPAAFHRFVCRNCVKGGRGVRLAAQITRDRPDEDQPPYPDAGTWRRLVSRYRS